VLEEMQPRLDDMPEALVLRRSTVEHPFGTIKAWMGATHFLTKTLPKVSTEMALQRARIQHQTGDRHPRDAQSDRSDQGIVRSLSPL